MRVQRGGQDGHRRAHHSTAGGNTGVQRSQDIRETKLSTPGNNIMIGVQIDLANVQMTNWQYEWSARYSVDPASGQVYQPLYVFKKVPRPM